MVLFELPDELVGDVLSGYIQLVDGVWHGVTLKYWHCVTDSLTTFNNHASCLTGRKQRKYRGIHDCQGFNSEVLEHDLGHLLFVFLGVKRGICEQHVDILWVQVKLVKYVFPQMHHVVEVFDNAPSDGEV